VSIPLASVAVKLKLTDVFCCHVSLAVCRLIAGPVMSLVNVRVIEVLTLDALSKLQFRFDYIETLRFMIGSSVIPWVLTIVAAFALLNQHLVHGTLFLFASHYLFFLVWAACLVFVSTMLVRTIASMTILLACPSSVFFIAITLYMSPFLSGCSTNVASVIIAVAICFCRYKKFSLILAFLLNLFH